MKRIHLPDVYSRLAEDEALAAAGLTGLPYQLYQHQLETFLALTQGTTPVVFNTAMTGDGKSLAGSLSLFEKEMYTLAMYPTNELIRDQKRAVEQMQQVWGTEFPVTLLNSHTLDEQMAACSTLKRGDALLSLMRNGDLVLSNPDVFHYLMQMFYVRQGPKGDAPDKIVGAFLRLFDQLTFDEFHIFKTPQIISVLNALLFLDQTGGANRYLFLSATPDPLMLDYLNRAGLSSTVIKGDYRHGASQPGWRKILRATDLYMVAGKAEEWVKEQVETVILPFFEQHQAAKGALIVNSVATALRLTAFLRPIFAARGLTVEPNTGLTGAEGRQRSYQATLLIGTSTVDVGVDFKINFLIFESRDGGSFLQRLGRMGRHEGYERADGTRVKFEHFQAYALVPDFIYERLFVGKQGDSPLIGGIEEMDRETFNAKITDVFPQANQFKSYAHRWGLIQSTRVIYSLGAPTIKESYEGTRQQLRKRYEQTFGCKLPVERFHALRKEADPKPIYSEASSFRGGSPWQAAAIDESQRGADRLVLYDLRRLLTNYQAELIDQEEFEAEVQRWGKNLKRFKRAEPIAYLRLQSLLPKRRPLTVHLATDLSDWSAERFDQVIELRGLSLSLDGFDELNALNREIAKRPFVAIVVLKHPAELQRQLFLPWPFPIEKVIGRDGIQGSIAFAREALLLETAMRERWLKSEVVGAIIC